MSKEYWASKPTEQIAEEIMSKFDEYQQWGSSSGYFSRIQKSFRTFYGLSSKGSLALEKSSDGKLTHLNVNHYKQLLQKLHSLVSSSKLSYEARSTNTDAESQIDTSLATGILEYYTHEKALGEILSEAALTALIAMEAWIFTEWDRELGEVITTDGMKEIREGDQSFQVLTAYDVARMTTYKNSPWKIVRLKKHRHTLAAQFPQHADEILQAESESNDHYSLDPVIDSYMSDSEIDDETVSVYWLFHEKGHVIPEGREVLICGDSVLIDQELTYKETPLYQIKAASVINNACFADSPGMSLMALQEAISLLTSAVSTNNLNSAISNLWSADPNLAVRKISSSQNLITSSVPPQPINFVGSSPETYNLIDSLKQTMNTLSGVSENPAPSASGSSISVQLAIQIQGISGFQRQYNDLAGSVGSAVIDNIKRFCKTEKVAFISGIRKSSYAKTFTAEDLSGVDRVLVNVGNGQVESKAGRYALLEQLLKYGAVRDPAVLSNFLKTGSLEDSTEDLFLDATLVRSENQALLAGTRPPVIITDSHTQHILKHREIFSDPEVRSNPQLMSLVLGHIQDHITAHKSIDPDLAAIIGIQPLPSQTQPPAPTPMPGQQPNQPNLPSAAPEQLEESYDQAMNNLPKQGQ